MRTHTYSYPRGCKHTHTPTSTYHRVDGHECPNLCFLSVLSLLVSEMVTEELHTVGQEVQDERASRQEAEKEAQQVGRRE